MRPTTNKALQHHHDMYAKLFKKMKGKLGPEEMEQYELAMRRERGMLVKPLPMPFYLKIVYEIIMTVVMFGLMFLTARYGGWLGGFQNLAFGFEALLWLLATMAILFNRN